MTDSVGFVGLQSMEMLKVRAALEEKLKQKDHDNKDASLKKNDDAIVATKKWSAYMVTTVVDFIFVVIPLIVFPTVLEDWTYINAILLLTVLLFCFTYRRCVSSVSPEGVQPVRTYISSYRVSMMLVTCFCILAVDFNIFPRRYAKTKTYGTSVGPLANVPIPPAPSNGQVTFRKGSNDHLAIDIDSESERLISKKDTAEEKGYIFKSLITSGLVPRQGMTIADIVDGIWVLPSVPPTLPETKN